MKVILRGPILSESGYGVHTRQIARWLLSRKNLELYFQLIQWGNTPWLINPTAENGLVGHVMSRSAPCPEKPAVSFQVQLPNEWDPNLAVKNIGVTAGVETDKCNPDWIKACNAMDLIIVPSQHVKTTFLASGDVTTPIVVVPESFPNSLPDAKPFDPGLQTDFNFLLFGQLTGNNPFNDRKNTFFAIKWLCEVFKDQPEVGVLIKTNSGRESVIDRQLTSDTLRKLASEVRKGPYPKINFLHGRLTDEQVAGLYKNPKVKALLAPTRGEGFGLPILEAAACGLPIITTGWSGHMDFMKKGRFISLEYSLQNVHSSRVDQNIFRSDARWAEVNEQDFKRKVTRFREASKIPSEWARELQPKILEQYNEMSIWPMYDAAIEEMK